MDQFLGAPAATPECLAPHAPLVARSNGPPWVDPFGDDDRQTWAECLRGEVAEGFSRVVFEGAASTTSWPARSACR